MSPVLNEVIDYLKSCDIKPTKEIIAEELNFYIKNLYSHVGEEAHKHSESIGIINDTGMTWEEMDAQMLKQIEEYKEALKELELVELQGDNMQYSVQIDRSVDALSNCLRRVSVYVEDIYKWKLTINASGIDYGVYFNFDIEAKELEISNCPEYDESLYLDDIIDLINGDEWKELGLWKQD